MRLTLASALRVSSPTVSSASVPVTRSITVALTGSWLVLGKYQELKYRQDRWPYRIGIDR